MKVPAGKIPLSEAFQKYCERRWRDAPTLNVRLALDRISEVQKRSDKRKDDLKNRRKNRRLTDNEKVKLREELSEELSGELKCISEQQRREEEAAKELRAAFENSELVAEAYDERDKPNSPPITLELTPEQWRDALFPERPFFGGAIVASLSDPLFDYNGLHPYTDKAAFNTWLDGKFDDDGPPAADGSEKDELPVRGHTLRSDLLAWYGEWVRGKSTEWLKYKGRSTWATPSEGDDLTAAREKFGSGVSRDMIRSLRRKFAPPDWTRAGKRKKL